MSGLRPKLQIVGQCTIDDVYQVDGRRIQSQPGGAALYAAIGAAMWPVQVGLVTRVGQDYDLEVFNRHPRVQTHVDLTCVHRHARPSIRDFAQYHADGTRTYDFADWQALNELTPTPDDLPPLPSPPTLLTAAPVALQHNLVTHLRPVQPVIACDTETHFFDHKERELFGLLQDVTYFMPSEEHVQRLFGQGTQQLLADARNFDAFGCPYVIMKRGRCGCVLFDRAHGACAAVPVCAGVQVVDPTGAGDAFCGGFMAAIACGQSPLEACLWGTVSASFVIESSGAAMPAHFTEERLQSRYEALRQSVMREQGGFIDGL